jgi:hypothetical protein
MRDGVGLVEAIPAVLRDGLLERFAALLLGVLTTWTVFGLGAAVADLVNRVAGSSEQSA